MRGQLQMALLLTLLERGKELAARYQGTPKQLVGLVGLKCLTIPYKGYLDLHLIVIRLHQYSNMPGKQVCFELLL